MDIKLTDSEVAMTQVQQKNKRKAGTPGGLSRWVQRKVNACTNRKIREGRGKFMGMDLLILNTVGRRSGQPRATPLAWFADGEASWLIIASGGGSQHPDWHGNLMAHPQGTSIEMPGRDAIPVTPHRLDGANREQAWQRIAAAAPQIAKHQSKSEPGISRDPTHRPLARIQASETTRVTWRPTTLSPS